MQLDENDVRKIAHLARLQLDAGAIDGYRKDLSNILDLVEQMNSVTTDGVVPLANPLDAVQRLRPDAVTETNRRDDFQRIAPDAKDGLYLVPKVLD